MFSIYTKVITPELSPVLGPAQSPSQIMEPLDNGPHQQQLQEQLIADKLGGFGLLCACCTSSRCTTHVSEYCIPDSSADYISIKTHPHTLHTPHTPHTLPTFVLEKCKDENHFTHYKYRVTTPRQMPPF